MRVVETESIKHSSELFNVFSHVLPEPRVIVGGLSESKFDAISPYDQVSSDVGARLLRSEIEERIGVPDPTVVGESERVGVVLLRSRVAGETSEEGFDERVPVTKRGRLAKEMRDQSSKCQAYFSVTSPFLGPCSSNRVYLIRPLVLSRIAFLSSSNSLYRSTLRTSSSLPKCSVA